MRPIWGYSFGDPRLLAGFTEEVNGVLLDSANSDEDIIDFGCVAGAICGHARSVTGAGVGGEGEPKAVCVADPERIADPPAQIVTAHEAAIERALVQALAGSAVRAVDIAVPGASVWPIALGGALACATGIMCALRQLPQR